MGRNIVEKVLVVCDTCETEFLRKPSHSARVKRNYCSIPCANKGFHLQVCKYDIDGTLLEKKCPTCTSWLLPKYFWADKSTQSGLHTSCIRCSKKKRYGLTEIEFEKFFQEGKCAGCGSKEDLCIDHDHSSGILRDLLCRKCNTILGLCDDNPTLLRRLADYLDEHNKE